MAFVGTELPEPIEFLELEHGHSIKLRIDSFEMGITKIHPAVVTGRHRRIHMEQQGLPAPVAADQPIWNEIAVLRVHGERLDATSPLRYWDISSKRLTAQLQPLLYAQAPNALTVTITASGSRPSKVFSVETGG
jgi:hypothetical protein